MTNNWRGPRPARALTCVIGCLGAFAIAQAPAAYAAYPDHQVNVVVGFAPGGTNDVLARLVSRALTEKFKQSFVVQNRPGAGGYFGTEYLVRAAPDGYTLIVDSTGPVAINPTLDKPLKYDTQTDLAPVALIAKVPNMLVVNTSLPITNFKQFVDYAKAHPGQLNYGSTGVGTSSHLSSFLLMSRLGVAATHVPYKGADSLNDLMGGRVQFLFDTMPALIGQVRAGKVRAIAISSTQRSPAAPDVPTVIESGLPGFETDSWFAIFAPKGTPKAVVEKLNGAVNESLASLKGQMLNLGAIPAGGSPASLGRFVHGEVVKWGDVVVKSGATAQ
jgi:tripartite-type tricarboxylate transporter receptor subunit TctC